MTCAFVIEMPGELTAALVVLIGAVAYWIRKKAASKPSAMEQAVDRSLELQAEGLRTQKEILKEIRNRACPWDGGAVPRQMETLLETERLKAALHRRKDS